MIRVVCMVCMCIHKYVCWYDRADVLILVHNDMQCVIFETCGKRKGLKKQTNNFQGACAEEIIEMGIT